MGKSLGIAAEVQDFLDEDVFNNEIFNRSVSRQAGLGLGDKLPDVIREAIEGQINLIQDIINQLPSDIAELLNESLLNTAVDIESTVKGDRLLEFDENKVEFHENDQKTEVLDGELAVLSLDLANMNSNQGKMEFLEEEYKLAA